MTDTSDALAPPAAVDCALLPLSAQRLPLLAPMNAIAEVVEALPELLTTDATPPWLLGWLRWRDITIPVLDHGGIGDHPVPVNADRRLVVFKAIGAAAQWGFYGLAIGSLPRPVRLGADSDLRGQQVPPPPGAAMLVEIGSEPALIPDFELLENLAGQAQALAPASG